jgi:hypothetical protein
VYCKIERRSGTFYTWIYFILFASLVNVSKCLLYFLVTYNRRVAFTTWDSFACLALIEVYKYCMQKPNEQVDLIALKLERKYCTILFWAVFVCFVFEFDFLSCVSTAYLGQLQVLISMEEKVKP